MKLLKITLVALLFLLNLAIAQPSFADRPKLEKNPDYLELTQTLNDLVSARDNQTLPRGMTAEQAQQKIANDGTTAGIDSGKRIRRKATILQTHLFHHRKKPSATSPATTRSTAYRRFAPCQDLEANASFKVGGLPLLRNSIKP